MASTAKAAPKRSTTSSTPAVQGGPSPASIVEALSWARTHPQDVAAALRKRVENYKGKDYYPPERAGRCVVTKEGADVVKEAIDYVLSLPALQPMKGPEKGLSLAAEDHVADIGVTGTASHNSSDGTQAMDRVKRYGTFSSFGECLWYGTEAADARTMILDLIVDDGVPTRGHRKGVLSSVYDTVGVAYGSHTTFGRVTALEFAKGWHGNDMFIRARETAGPVKISKEAMAKAKAAASTQWELGSCPMCKQPIQGGRVVDVTHIGKMHADCFKCSSCSTSLAGGEFKIHEKQAYCTACYGEKFAERCKACNKPVTDTAMKCSLGTFHMQCAVCATCKTRVDKTPCSTAGGVLQCQACARGVSAKAKPAAKASSSAAKASSLSSAGKGVLSAPDSAGPKRTPAKATSSAAPKSKAKAKSTSTVSMSQAKATTVLVGMDYMGLD
mmetsp:Transcript_31833/g.74382  ORF Transcript_31833/g.74382 Transcript_31833/m.74382 type:complete len:442 (+) Transcript_31833:83-1408(+)